ncbi:Zinc finger PHD-type [Penicillium cf. griseofulvum]|uniref:Transcription factor BYE1 n=1 Tax=Penicillium cf. griseofulvum TaxID=2972120 RepID=A0A9W9J3T8_9EURO|nr:Zinc finger PHD-type [Penicillium cf. griseofulvum]KAJ5435218.1 Zinc finger PHD-type [Penicillium cf. griseofulvum]
MADEPRRSGRATKGQHKNLELPDDPAKKGKSKSPKEKSAKLSAEPTPGPSEGEGGEEEIIRCICGEYEEEEDVERDMICCDQCSAWQHNDCMGLTFTKGQEPDQYYCEQCRPENHTKLLAKINAGEKPWEELAEKRRQEAEEKKSKRKKGKKGGRKGRPSESRTDASTPARTAPSTTPGPGGSPTPAVSVSVEPEKNGHVDSRRSSTNKRKLEDTVEAENGPQVKQQRVSPQPTPAAVTEATEPQIKADPTPEASAIGALDELIPARKSVATHLIKLFVDQITAALKAGSFTLRENQSAEDMAQQLALSIEDAMYEIICGRSGEPNESYKAQLRSIMFNVKKNASLRDRLLIGSLSPKSLAQMTSAEMASKELQQKDAEIKREADRHHTIVQEQGPRIRRTHKGEELIEDEHHGANESVFSRGPRRVVDDDGSPTHKSPTSPMGQQQPKTETDGYVRGLSPEGAHHDHVFPEVAPTIYEPLPSGRVQADAEIDQLLRDEEPYSPPYSPKDFDDDGTVWRGKVTMPPIGEFSSSAKHVGGADLSGRIPWSQLAPSTLVVDGRIDIRRATDYLCGLQFSKSTDVSVLAVSSPDQPTDRAGFDKMFDYFHSRGRYGVIGKHPLSAVKDTYIVPMEIGTTTMPEFIELLENISLEGPITQRMLLIIFVVKTGESNPSSVQPPSHQASQEPPVSGSPAVAATPQQPQFNAGVAPTPPSHFGGFNPNPAPYGQQAPVQQVQATPQHQPALTGLPAAVQVLGPQVDAPAIQQLLKTAPSVDMAQLSVVRDILARQPAAAAHYDTLMQALFETQANGHVPQHGV